MKRKVQLSRKILNVPTSIKLEFSKYLTISQIQGKQKLLTEKMRSSLKILLDFWVNRHVKKKINKTTKKNKESKHKTAKLTIKT